MELLPRWCQSIKLHGTTSHWYLYATLHGVTSQWYSYAKSHGSYPSGTYMPNYTAADRTRHYIPEDTSPTNHTASHPSDFSLPNKTAPHACLPNCTGPYPREYIYTKLHGVITRMVPICQTTRLYILKTWVVIVAWEPQMSRCVGVPSGQTDKWASPMCWLVCVSPVDMLPDKDYKIVCLNARTRLAPRLIYTLNSLSFYGFLVKTRLMLI
jgi:hypothetical protein